MSEFMVFISYKNKNKLGEQTPDSLMASDLYNALMKRGINTFFSKSSLEKIGVDQYKKAIDNALDQCRVLIAVGTSVENLTSQWVNYEWDSFYGDILSGLKKDAKVFSYINDISPQMLPRSLRQLQVFEKKENTIDEICDYIEHAVGNNNIAKETNKHEHLDRNINRKDQTYEVIEGSDITINDIKQALELDKMVYEEEYYVTLERCCEWYKRNNEIYTMIRDKQLNKIVAYINVCPVNDEIYDKIKSGEFIDTYLPAEAILDFDMPCLYNLYFASVVIHPDYQNKGMFAPLFDAIVNKFMRLGENEIYMKRMIADAVTERGRKFCLLFGMDKINTSGHNSDIYEVELLPPKFKITSKAGSALYKYYEAMANELDYL